MPEEAPVMKTAWPAKRWRDVAPMARYGVWRMMASSA